MILYHRSVFRKTGLSLSPKPFQTKLEQLSVVASVKRRYNTWRFSILSCVRIVFHEKIMPQNILKERTAHLVSYTSFTRDVDQYQNTSTTINTFFTEHVSLATFVL